MEIPVHCLPYGLMRIQSSMFPTSVLTLGNFFFFLFFLKRGGMGTKDGACFPIIFFHSYPFLRFHCFLSPLSSHHLSICDRRGRMF